MKVVVHILVDRCAVICACQKSPVNEQPGKVFGLSRTVPGPRLGVPFPVSTDSRQTTWPIYYIYVLVRGQTEKIRNLCEVDQVSSGYMDSMAD